MAISKMSCWEDYLSNRYECTAKIGEPVFYNVRAELDEDTGDVRMFSRLVDVDLPCAIESIRGVIGDAMPPGETVTTRDAPKLGPGSIAISVVMQTSDDDIPPRH